jgi:hypothetical protein
MSIIKVKWITVGHRLPKEGRMVGVKGTRDGNLWYGKGSVQGGSWRVLNANDSEVVGEVIISDWRHD